MTTRPHKIQQLSFTVVVSILAHLLTIYALGWFGSFDLSPPVVLISPTMVELTARELPAPDLQERDPLTPDEGVPLDGEGKAGPASAETVAATVKKDGGSTETFRPTGMVNPPAVTDETTGGDDADIGSAETREASRKVAAVLITPPLRMAGEFMEPERESLSYRLSLLGVPVGTAILEAKQKNDEIRITLRVSSGPAIASIYPVNGFIETRHIGGNYIITRIRLQEGMSRSDKGFTLFLRDKSVFWINLINKGTMREPIPNSDVVDILSGLYYLRNRPLQIGTSETLHLYDSDAYDVVPVEVLRRERVDLPGFTNVKTLVLQPHLKAEGISGRAKDILIWVTDDENRVPVRVETTMALGRVAAELTSSEIQREGVAESTK